MRFAALFLIGLFPVLAQAGLGSDAGQRLCQAATQEAQLEVALAELAADDAMSAARGSTLLFLSCGETTLLEVMVEARQAENLEYAIIDMGVDVREPLVPEEGGKLDVTQYLLQQAAQNPSGRRSIASMGGKNNNAKRLLDKETGKVYGSIKDASKKLKMNYSTLMTQMKKGQHTNLIRIQ